MYADADTAMAAVETEDAVEQAAHAVRQAPIAGLSSRQVVWIEAAPDRPGFGIVRVTWQTLNVVSQVGALGPIGPSEPARTAQLAMVEQDRLGVAT